MDPIIETFKKNIDKNNDVQDLRQIYNELGKRLMDIERTPMLSTIFGLPVDHDLALNILYVQMNLVRFRIKYLIHANRYSWYFRIVKNKKTVRQIVEVPITTRQRKNVMTMAWNRVHRYMPAKQQKVDLWYNRFGILQDDSDDDLYDETHYEFGFVDAATPTPRPPTYYQAASQLGTYTDRHSPVVRDGTLLQRLRTRIWELSMFMRSRTFWAHPLLSLSDFYHKKRNEQLVVMRTLSGDHLIYLPKTEGQEMIEMQMADVEQADAHGAITSKQKEAGNVVLTETTEGETASALPATIRKADWISMASSDTRAQVSGMTDRWLKITEFKWSTNSADDTDIARIELPRDIVLNDQWADCDMNVTIPFKVNRYVHFDSIDVKIQINSNRFQLGQLLCAWYYEPHLDANFKKCRMNKFTMSQAPHVLVSAGASNEATLNIPYRAHTPMIATKDRKDKMRALSMGVLFVRVLNRLSVPQGAPSVVYGSVFVRLNNATFTGQIAGSLSTPRIDDAITFQMDRILHAAEAALHTYNCPNMDNPPVPFNAPFLIPTASHSWAVGTGDREPIHPLRLDARCQTAFPDELEDEMIISKIAQQYGLVSTILWKPTSEGVIGTFEAAPIMKLKRYKYFDQDAENATKSYHLKGYCIPPVAVIAALNKYQRGPLKFKFDVIATQFHTGRLIVGYVPGATEDDRVQVKHLLAGPHTVLDIRDATSFTYSVPFVHDMPFAQRNYQGNFVDDVAIPPSMLYVGVMNRLTATDTVEKNVYINVYMAADEGFEVAVPVQPAIGTYFYDEMVLWGTEVIQANSDSFPYYGGTYYAFKKSQALVMRHGQTSGNVSYFDATYLKLNALPKPGISGRTYIYELMHPEKAAQVKFGNQFVKCIYTILVWDNKQKGTALMVPARNQVAAQAAALDYLQSKEDGSAIHDDFIFPAGDTTNNIWCKDNPVYKPILVPIDPLPVPPKLIVSSDEESTSYELIEAQGDDDKQMVSTSMRLTSTKQGEVIFGETFKHFKDYLRRYQLYAGVILDLTAQPVPGQLSFILPVLPQGLSLNVGTTRKPIEITNRNREGLIPIILSGYRYYRGGIRMRIVIPSKTDILVYLQHKNDRRLRTLRPIVVKRVTSGEDLFNNGYAYYIQDTGVNSIVEVEIPYYYSGMNSLLQTPMLLSTEEANAYSLGELAIGFNMLQRDIVSLRNVYITAFYSVADDFQASVFQGFPPMVFTDEIEQIDTVETQGFGWDWLTGGLKDTIKSGVKEEVTVVTDKIEATISQVRQDMEIKGLADVFSSSFVRMCISQLAHVVVNFSWKGLGIAITTILVEIGCVVHNFMQKALDAVMKFVQFIRSKVDIENESGNQQNEPDVAEEVQCQSGNELDGTVGLITLLWTGLCSLFSISNAKLTSVNGWSAFLTRDLTGAMKSGNIVFVFVRNLHSCMAGMKEKLFGVKEPKLVICDEMTNLFPEFQAWVDEVFYLSDVSTFEKYKYVQWYSIRVMHAYSQGSIFFSKIYGIQNPTIARSVTTVFARISDIRTKMEEFGGDAYVRKEPFVIWQAGPSGVGKSTVATDISLRLLQVAGIQYNVPPIYVHNVSSEFWDSERGNPVMMVDEMFNVQSGTFFERQLMLLFAVVSPVVLSPPKARLEDKGRTYNPHIVFMNSNHEFVNFNNVHMEAVHRRRHVLIRSQTSRTKKDNCAHCRGVKLEECPITDIADYHHMEFFLAKNVVDPSTAYDGPYTYIELIGILEKKFQRHRIHAETMYSERINRIMAILDSTNPMEKSYQERVKEYKDEQERKCKAFVDEHYTKPIVEVFKQVKDKSANYTTEVLEYLKKYVAPEQIQPQIEAWQYEAFSFPRCVDLVNTAILKSTASYDVNKHGAMQSTVLRIFVFMHGDTWPNRQNTTIEPGLRDYIVGYLGYQVVHEVTVDDMIDQMLAFFSQIVGKRTRSTKKGTVRDKDTGKKRVVDIVYDENPCECYSYDWYNVSCDPDVFKIMIPDDNGDMQVPGCEDDMCCWNSDIFKFAICYKLLSNDSTVRMAYGAGIDRCLPLEFRKSARPDLCASTWQQCWQDMKERYRAFVLDAAPRLQKFLEIMKVVGMFILALAPMICMISVPILTYKLAKQATQTNTGWETHTQGSAYTSNPNVVLNDNVRTAQMQAEVPQKNVAIDRILRNMFQITCKFGQQSVKFTGVVIRSRTLLLIRHYHEELQAITADNTALSFYGTFPYRNDNFSATLGLQFHYFDCKMQFYNRRTTNGVYASNFYLIELPVIFPECKDITKLFATEKEHARANGDGMLVRSDGRLVEGVRYTMEHGRPVSITATDKTSAVTLEQVYSYPMQAKGMCGSILIANNLERCIIGVHVAGVVSGSIRGLAEILQYETFNEVLKDITPVDFVMPVLDPISSEDLKFTTALYALGKTPKDMVNHQSSDTAFCPSVIQGVYPIRTAPNPLSPSDKRLPPGTSPLYTGIDHMGKPPLDFESQLVETVAEDYTRVLLNNCKPIIGNRTLTLQEAVCGDKNVDGLNALEWSTSPGFPLKFQKDNKNQSGKKWLFDLHETPEGYVLKGMHPKLAKLYATDMECRSRAIKPFTVFIDCLKDTCLPVEKNIIPGKTRIFSISPVQYTIAFRQYFGAFMIAYRAARFDVESAIGINADSLEWTDLARYVMSKGSKLVAGDYKNFGPALMLKLVRRAMLMIMEWYDNQGTTSEEQNIRKMLMEELMNAYHLCFNTIYQTPCGIPSGMPMTDIINSIVNALYVRTAFVTITKLPVLHFREYCSLVVYGDDLLMGVSDKIADVFNTTSMSAFFQQYNIVFTDADKSDKIIAYRSLETCTFLKRHFVQHPSRTGIYMAKLDEVSIHGCINWIKKKNNLHQASIYNCELAVMLAHSYGKAYYDAMLSTLRQALQQHNLQMRYHSWHELDRMRYSDLASIGKLCFGIESLLDF